MSVYSNVRTLKAPPISWDDFPVAINKKHKMNGLDLLKQIPDGVVPVVFFDPQYRGVLEKLNYGNEGQRQKSRCLLQQMDDQIIWQFVNAIERVLMPSGHLFLWLDKFHLCEGISKWICLDSTLSTVDLLTWDKLRIGMGYRTRRECEYLIVLQKVPLRAKGVWMNHSIPDIYRQKAIRSKNKVHPKPIQLQADLIAAITNPGDIVVDPAAGSYTVMSAARMYERNFLGCDLA